MLNFPHITLLDLPNLCLDISRVSLIIPHYHDYCHNSTDIYTGVRANCRRRDVVSDYRVTPVSLIFLCNNNCTATILHCLCSQNSASNWHNRDNPLPVLVLPQPACVVTVSDSRGAGLHNASGFWTAFDLDPLSPVQVMLHVVSALMVTFLTEIMWSLRKIGYFYQNRGNYNKHRFGDIPCNVSAAILKMAEKYRLRICTTCNFVYAYQYVTLVLLTLE